MISRVLFPLRQYFTTFTNRPEPEANLYGFRKLEVVYCEYKRVSGNANMKIAKEISGTLIDIEKATSDSKYYCIDCGQEVFPKNKKPIELRLREIHFAHFSEFPCTGNLESYLHKIAKTLIAAEKQINFPILGLINYVNSYVETYIGNIRPDIIIETEHTQIAIEIFVSHKTEWKKIDKYKENNTTCFEIDLSGLDYNSDLEIIKKELFENLGNKIPLHIRKESVTVGKKTKSYLLEIIVGIVLSLIALFVLEKTSESTRRNRKASKR